MQVENERIIFRGTHALDPKLVFDALIGWMAKAEKDRARMRVLTNLLLQRIGGRVQLSRETITHIHSRSEEVFGQ